MLSIATWVQPAWRRRRISRWDQTEDRGGRSRPSTRWSMYHSGDEHAHPVLFFGIGGAACLHGKRDRPTRQIAAENDTFLRQVHDQITAGVGIAQESNANLSSVLIEANAIQRVLAQVKIHFSNSMIDSW